MSTLKSFLTGAMQIPRYSLMR